MDRRERLDDPEESLRMAMEGSQARLWTAMPCIVSSVDLIAQTLVVQPAIKGEVTNTDGTTSLVNMPVLVDVPIVWPRAGGFALTFPIAVNDEVLVVFASRCIDAWWQNGGVGAPAEVRMHDLSDGFAILAPTSQPKKLANVSAANVQLRDEAGTTFLEIAPGGKIKVTAVSEINLIAPLMKLAGAVEITGTLKQTGAVTVVGDINQTGALLTSVSVTSPSVVSGGKPFNTHTHGGITTGTGTSGIPS
jgi:Phage protein Gp138 N-terminal domain